MPACGTGYDLYSFVGTNGLRKQEPEVIRAGTAGAFPIFKSTIRDAEAIAERMLREPGKSANLSDGHVRYIPQLAENAVAILRGDRVRNVCGDWARTTGYKIIAALCGNCLAP